MVLARRLRTEAVTKLDGKSVDDRLVECFLKERAKLGILPTGQVTASCIHNE
jgi:hypothetical protein